MHPRNQLCFVLILFLLASGCKRTADSTEPIVPEVAEKNIPPKGFFIEDRKVAGVAPDRAGKEQPPSLATNALNGSTAPDPNNGDDPVVLGSQLANPYALAHMQQAVNTLYGGNYPISA